MNDGTKQHPKSLKESTDEMPKESPKYSIPYNSRSSHVYHSARRTGLYSNIQYNPDIGRGEQKVPHKNNHLPLALLQLGLC